MSITTYEIVEEFEALSKIDWADYVQLCADEHELREYEEHVRLVGVGS